MATLKRHCTARLCLLSRPYPVSSIATRAYLLEETRHRILTVAEELGYTKEAPQNWRISQA